MNRRTADAPSSANQTRTLNTKSTGEILRTAREAAGLSVDQLSQQINVRPSMIKSIEEGKFYGLTDPLYLKGFIRSYAHQVGLADDQVLPFFRREYDEQEHQQKLTQPLAPIQAKKSKITPGWLVVAFLILSILGVVGYAYQQYVSVALTPQLQVDSPSDSISTTSDQVTASGRVDPDAILTLNGQELPIDPQGNFSTAVGLASGNNQLAFTATNKLGKSTTVERVVVSTYTVAVLPSPTPVLGASSSAQASSSATLTPGGQPAANQLILLVTVGPNPAWIEISVDGQKNFSGLVLPGGSKQVSATTRINLKTGNAGSTKVTFNGQDQGTLGAEGEVLNKTYTR